MNTNSYKTFAIVIEEIHAGGTNVELKFDKIEIFGTPDFHSDITENKPIEFLNESYTNNVNFKLITESKLKNLHLKIKKLEIPDELNYSKDLSKLLNSRIPYKIDNYVFEHNDNFKLKRERNIHWIFIKIMMILVQQCMKTPIILIMDTKM